MVLVTAGQGFLERGVQHSKRTSCTFLPWAWHWSHCLQWHFIECQGADEPPPLGCCATAEFGNCWKIGLCLGRGREDRPANPSLCCSGMLSIVMLMYYIFTESSPQRSCVATVSKYHASFELIYDSIDKMMAKPAIEQYFPSMLMHISVFNTFCADII